MSDAIPSSDHKEKEPHNHSRESDMRDAVLVPLDGLTDSEQVLSVALAIAQAIGATVDLTHVHQVLPYFGEAPAYDNALDIEEAHRMREPIIALAQQSAREHGVPVTATLLLGSVARTLEEYTSERAVRLIVMASHGRGGLSRALLGSVADRLIRRSATPVLLVRPVDGNGAPQVKWPPARVLVPLDGSGLSGEVLAPLTQLIGLAGKELFLLRIVEPVPSLEPFPDIAGIVDGDATRETRDADNAQAAEEGQRYLDKFAARLLDDGVRARTHVAIHASAADAILEYANESGVDLIALATHGRSGLTRAFVGSVADEVMRRATVSVLIVGPDRDPAEGTQE
jgi:nucleotide-binding universal stress UspA family protein